MMSKNKPKSDENILRMGTNLIRLGQLVSLFSVRVLTNQESEEAVDLTEVCSEFLHLMKGDQDWKFGDPLPD